MSSYYWPPTGSSGGGVPIYVNFAAFPSPSSVPAGTLGVAADTGIIYESNGTIWQVEAGPGVVLSVGAFSNTATAQGLSITSNAISMTAADATHPGGIKASGSQALGVTLTAVNLSGTNTGDVTLGTASGLSLSGQILSLALSSTSTTGALSSTDWNTFNGKQNLLTLGNLTSAVTTNLSVSGGTGSIIGSGVVLTLTGASLVESTSSVLTITGATNAVLGTGVSIQVKQSSTSQAGYLSSTDWNTFNGKQAGPLTGDVTTSGAASTLATVNSNVGPFTYASITVNAKGLVTAASNGSAPPALIVPKITTYSVATSNTFSTTGSPLYIRVRLVGGGGGGGGGGTGTSSQTDGGDTTFGTSLLIAGGGGAGLNANRGGVGGTPTMNSPAVGTALTGGAGAGAVASGLGISVAGGTGGTTVFGGAGYTNLVAPGSPAPNSGAGGGGGGVNPVASQYSGSGGGSGAFIDAIITSPSSSYSYTVGNKGVGGNAGGASGANGSDGAVGYIEVTEFYQ